VNGSDFVTAARSFMGCRWRHQGRSREGVDCIGLVVAARAAVGLETLDVNDYSRKQPGEPMLKYCREHMLPIGRDALQPGDILVMAYGDFRHMAIVADCVYGGLSIIDAHFEIGKVVERRLDDSLLSRVRGCFRMPEFAA
jgi:hypothetical protein